VDANDLFAFEQLIRLLAHDGRQHGEHLVLIATAFEPVSALLQEGKFDILIESSDRDLVERSHP
jgi:hypothetical protein